jgi:non-heme chloroperoxidase
VVADLRKSNNVNFSNAFGDDDQIVPIGASASLSAKLVKNAQLKVYSGGSHGMCTTQKDEVNADLLAFIKS